MAETSRRNGVALGVVKAIRHDLSNNSGGAYRASVEDEVGSGPVPLERLSAAAAASLDDIALFALRYFGLILMPWQVEAVEQIVKLQATDDEEYVVINVAPGTGKSTFFTYVLPAWLTCRDRTIRGLLGSAAQTTANWYTGRLRTAFTRRVPVKAKANDLKLGIAVDAVATLVGDFGRFKPASGGEDRWSADAFSVAQFDDVPVSEKESTWMAFGRSGTFLGARVDVCIWDDVYDPSQMRTSEARAGLKRWWEDVAETRLEPGGLLILQGQRMGPDDIYQHALKMPAADVEVDDGDAEPDPDGPKKYHHIVFKAHYEDRCRGRETHRRDSAPYPEGCLLYPRRLPWSKLQPLRDHAHEKFEVVYQQGDSDPESVLVQRVWVDGGTGLEGELCPGCWDMDRGLGELPPGLTPPLLSVVTADPSPTKYWSVQWWIYQPATQLRFFMDMERRKMEASDFLDWNNARQEFVGLMESWQRRSLALGVPISHWVVEQNAAQRFMLQYEHVTRWMQKWGVAIIPHDTYGNKSDPKLGVGAIAPHWHYGRVRLPGRPFDKGRLMALKLVDEVTHYPDWATDDCVMAQWFFEWRLPWLYRERRDLGKQQRPTWMLQPTG